MAAVMTRRRLEPEATMPEADLPSRARRSGFVPLCAALLGVLCGLGIPGCLNPLPDEQPSYRGVAAPPVVEGPGLSGDLVDDPLGGGIGLESSSGEDDDPPASEAPAPPQAPVPRPLPDAGAPEAGTAADEEPEGSVR